MIEAKPSEAVSTTVETHIRRGDSSRLAERARNHNFHAVRYIVVAQNTPQWIDRTRPGAVDAPTSPRRWTKHGQDISTWAKVLTSDSGSNVALWVKTATLGGKAKVYTASYTPGKLFPEVNLQ